MIDIVSNPDILYSNAKYSIVSQD